MPRSQSRPTQLWRPLLFPLAAGNDAYGHFSKMTGDRTDVRSRGEAALGMTISPTRGAKRETEEAILPDGQNTQKSVNPYLKKYSDLQKVQSGSIFLTIPPHQKWRVAIVTFA